MRGLAEDPRGRVALTGVTRRADRNTITTTAPRSAPTAAS
jgi:hypothetical protein